MSNPPLDSPPIRDFGLTFGVWTEKVSTTTTHLNLFEVNLWAFWYIFAYVSLIIVELCMDKKKTVQDAALLANLIPVGINVWTNVQASPVMCPDLQLWLNCLADCKRRLRTMFLLFRLESAQVLENENSGNWTPKISVSIICLCSDIRGQGCGFPASKY